MLCRTLALLSLLLCSALAAHAETLQMECLHWIDGKFSRTDYFAYEVPTKKLVATSISDVKVQTNFRNVVTWNLMYADKRTYVLYGLDTGPYAWAGPVVVLTLDFASVKTFDYELGGLLEGDIIVSKLEQKCKRTD